MKHISEDILGTLSSELDGKTIVHCVTSSISCFLAPKISRLLMRNGAKVIPVLSPEAAKFVHPMIFEWATGNEPIVTIEGKVEHVHYAGLSKEKADLILIAPITANSLSKIANGIMDTSVTLMAGTALGNNIPMIIVPTMHEVMLYNPSVKENIKKLEKMGVKVLMPLIEEEKAKIPSEEYIVNEVVKELTEKTFENTSVLVTAGPTRAYIDGIRFISNPSSGKMGFALALEAWKKGAKVKVVYGATELSPEKNIEEKVKVERPEEMYLEVLESLKKEKYDFVILAAAMNDFAAEEIPDEKIKSKSEWLLKLKPVAKLADKIKEISPETTLVLFKAEYAKTDEELVEIAKQRLEKAQADFIVANDVSVKKYGFASYQNRVALISKDKEKVQWFEGSKKEVARKILENIRKKM
ncbi:MAG: bifunctional phosphopantothenoylcysteine decarboxylase/phosphopantothenate--cysteine ligase CoaBC [Candidatus Heimdallarchaeum aukensis]|uniref:Coenzyme A biosynthesis bifunctional protein CoaBC n=1 Tax=Candidatus Heimdallarchaeum aukensis TaxID=2876573 RepID=A0A9Y1BLT3_9ARCH|nr:MAG: bifunctional phosphopantothenoylcysteine decarboxylase/phosphopantothenate--cysteine ligase CoaBC [Candidatus Heimdallarchaeum aukensis]